MGDIYTEYMVVKKPDAIDTVKKLVPAKKTELVEMNMKALEAGYNYKG